METISIHEVHEKYKNLRGFAVKKKNPFTEADSNKAVSVWPNWAKEKPKHVCLDSDQNILFVLFEDSACFQSGDFYARSRQAEQILQWFGPIIVDIWPAVYENFSQHE